MEIYVARQPIFDKKRKIYGYELLFRNGSSNSFPDIDGDTATSTVLSNSFFRMGIDQVSGGKKAFVNFTEQLLLKMVPLMFNPRRLVVEILEQVRPEGDLVRACEEMAAKGYEMALDDFSYTPEYVPLIRLSKIIKLDFRATPMEVIEEYVGKLSNHSVKFLAEKVETHEEFQKAKELGFSYFQGYFFSKPEILKDRDISPSKLTLLQIMAETNQDDFRFGELEKLISRDVSISYKLLRYMNSSFFKRAKEISSIKQAIVLLGEQGIRRFISLVIMAKLAEGKPDELVRTSIVRARLCELIGKHSGLSVDEPELFTLGLFSLIDAILDESMDNLMSKLPLSEGIKGALVDGVGSLTDFLNLARHYEAGNWGGVKETASKIGLEEERMPGFYMDAVGWADCLSSG